MIFLFKRDGKANKKRNSTTFYVDYKEDWLDWLGTVLCLQGVALKWYGNEIKMAKSREEMKREGSLLWKSFAVWKVKLKKVLRSAIYGNCLNK